MGEVYRARDTRVDRPVALKVLPEEFFEDGESRARFGREARTLASLNHPGIATLYSFEELSGRHVLAMELVEGATLRERLSRGPIPPRQAADLALQIARGLSAAHEKGIVHRDLKPENLLVTEDGRLKILDFGLAKRAEPDAPGDGSRAPTAAKLTEAGVVLGTTGYMSPEQVKGLAVDHRSDLFSFGAVLYEMLSGNRAFKKGSAAETMAAILTEDPPELSDGPEGVSPALGHIVRRCLEKDPKRRFQTAHDLEFALSEASGPASTRGTDRLGTTAPSRRWRLALLGAGVVAIVAAASVLALRRGSPRPAALATSAPSIAVLPFTNLSGDKEQEYFSDGLSEELADLLTKVKGLHVAGHTSSSAFKGRAEDLAAIGRKLQVTTVLEGSVRRSNEQLRVSARLVNVADGYQIWAETYDRTIKDIFALQDEIAGAVVAALKVRLLPEERAAQSRHRTSNPEAYIQYVMGKRFNGSRSGAGSRRAIAAFRKAIALDPGYAPAWAGLAMADFWVSDSAASTPVEIAELRQDALVAADRALSLDPELPEGYEARGFLRLGFTFDWDGARSDLERALSLDPGNASTHVWYGELLATLGRLPEAIAEERRAIEIDPLLPEAWIMMTPKLGASRKFAEAQEAASRALEITPESEAVHYYLGLSRVLEGKTQDALPEFERAGPIFRLTGLAIAEHELGQPEPSRRALDELIARYPHSAAIQIAGVFAWRGEKDRAFAWLDRAYAQRDSGCGDLEWAPLFERIRDDPRYVAMLKKLNLPTGS
jgi:serine/threonine protein kinase/tetratricopeptide (TPR) repeat protein